VAIDQILHLDIYVLHLSLSLSWSQRFLKVPQKDSGHRNYFISISVVSLILGDTPFSVGLRPLIANCDLFANRDVPTSSPYCVMPNVPLDGFRQFIEGIEGKAIKVTNQNILSLTQLCDEFGFQTLSLKVSAFRNSSEFRGSADDEVRSQISGLEERVSQQERRIAALEAEMAQMKLNLAQLISNAQTTPPQIQASSQVPQTQIPAQPAPQLSPP
jgi:uncharacterized coiled-coil protein SlyX